MFEKTKILDHIYVKYGLKLNQLEHACEHFKLNEDEDIKTFKNFMSMQQKQDMEE